MTTNTRAAALTHIMGMLNLEQNIREYLKEQGYATIGHLSNRTPQDVEDLKTESEGIFKLGHAKSIKFFKDWINDYLATNDTLPQDWTNEFTTEAFEAFMIKQSTSKPTPTTNVTAPSQVSSTMTTKLLSNVKCLMHFYSLN